MQTLLQYLANLANDPAAQQSFAQNPEAAISAAPLSDADKNVLRTRNAGLIHATVGQQALAAMIYATHPAPPAMIYAAPMIYAQPQPAPMIYAQPPPAPMIYAQPPPAPMIYAQPHPAMIYGAGAGAGAPMMIYAHAAPPAMIYAAQPAAQPMMIYAPKPGDPPK